MRWLASVAACALISGCASMEQPQTQPSIPQLPPSLQPPPPEPEPDPILVATENGRRVKVNSTTFLQYDATREHRVSVCYGRGITHIVLAPGESTRVNKSPAVFADPNPDRWTLLQSRAGAKEVLSVSAASSGQQSEMTVMTTEREYMFRLVSSAHCDKRVQFIYPEQVLATKVKSRGIHSPFYPERVRYDLSWKASKGPIPRWYPVSMWTHDNVAWIQFPDAPGVVGAPVVTVDGAPASPRIEADFFAITTPIVSTATLSLGESEVRISRK